MEEINLDRILFNDAGGIGNFVRNEITNNPNGAVKKYLIDRCVAKLQKNFEDYQNQGRDRLVVSYVIGSVEQNLIAAGFSDLSLTFARTASVNLGYYRAFRYISLFSFKKLFCNPKSLSVWCYGGDILDVMNEYGVHICSVDTVLNDSVYGVYAKVQKGMNNKYINAEWLNYSGMQGVSYDNKLDTNVICNCMCERKILNGYSFMDFLTVNIDKFLILAHNRGVRFMRLYMPFCSDIMFTTAGDVNEIISFRVANGRIRFYSKQDHLVFDYDFDNYIW